MNDVLYVQFHLFLAASNIALISRHSLGVSHTEWLNWCEYGFNRRYVITHGHDKECWLSCGQAVSHRDRNMRSRDKHDILVRHIFRILISAIFLWRKSWFPPQCFGNSYLLQRIVESVCSAVVLSRFSTVRSTQSLWSGVEQKCCDSKIAQIQAQLTSARKANLDCG